MSALISCTAYNSLSLRELNQNFLGKTLKVLVEGYHKETELLIQGRHQGQAPDVDGSVLINDIKGSRLKVGDFIQAEVTDGHNYDLVANIVD